MFAKLRYQACIPVILIGLSLWGVPSSTVEELTSPCVNDAGIALEWQAEVNKVDNFSRLNYSDNYSWSRIGGCKAEIHFKNDVPDKVLKMANLIPNLRVSGGVGFSEDEIMGKQEEVFYNLREELGGSVSAYTDVPNAVIHIEVPVSSINKVSNLLKDKKLSANVKSPFKIQYDYTDSTESGYDALYGGGYLTSCTTAFSVSSNGYPNGLLTAGHCANEPQSYGGVSLKLRGKHQGQYGDVSWFSTSAWTAPQFYTLPSHLVNVTQTAYPTVGQNLCLNGRGSGTRFCDETVWDIRTCSSNGICNLTAMSGRKARGGDSGGPWFSSSIAYGVHSGHIKFGSVERDVFTPIQIAESVLGVRVKKK